MSHIQDLRIIDVRNIKPIKFHVGVSLRHLIVTGRNGAGKTTLLNAIKRELGLIKNNHPSVLASNRQVYDQRIKLALDLGEQELKDIKAALDREVPYGKREVFLNLGAGLPESFIVVSFDSKRLTNPSVPKGPMKFQPVERKEISSKAGQQIVQYLVNLWTEKAYANTDNDMGRVEEIDRWFEDFRVNLAALFEDESLRLVFDRKIYNFWVHQASKEPFSLNQLSDGLSSAFSIISELIMRMQNDGATASFDQSGIVLIDEVETHLHVSLQKLILPFLTRLFQNIQFIVTTHSPFVLSSISDSVILDLDRGEVFNDFSGFSYEAVLEDFLDVDKYSIRTPCRRKNYDAAESLIEKLRSDAGKIGEGIGTRAPELDLMLERFQMKINEGRSQL